MQIEDGPEVDSGRLLSSHGLSGRHCSSAIAGKQSVASPTRCVE